MATMLWPIVRKALRYPTRTIIVDDQRQWRYIDLLGGAMFLAERLEQLTGNRRIGILLPTSGASAMALLAIWLLKRTAVPLNFLLAETERDYIIRDSELDLIITAGAMLEFLGSEPKGVNLLKLDELRFHGVPPFRMPPVAAGDDIAVILYTSGTSGRPKGVMLTHANLRWNCRASIRHARITTSDGFLGVLPQFHSFGLTVLTLIPLMGGAKVIYTARFVPKKLVDLMKEHRPDIFVGIPSMYHAMLGVKSATPADFASIRLAVSGGEPLPREIHERFMQQYEVDILEGYGLTETSPVVAWCTPWARQTSSVGKVLAGCEVRIVDDEERDVPRGQQGEVLIKGPNVMAGYLKLPEATAEAFTADGYFRTGDWGRIDRDGYLAITGRKKEMMIIGGENVFPREIEEVLGRHPAVAACGVTGQQDLSRGEVAVAFVELDEGATFDEAELRSWCRKELAGYKVPRRIYAAAALPRSPIGKVLRRELAKLIPEAPATDEAPAER